jgi:undecaprenyl diphosphate synthase
MGILNFGFINLFKKRKRRKQLLETVDPKAIPTHIAVVMDGNGRWAQSHGLPRVAGHHEGMKTVREIAIAASDLGVKVLTLYAFSTENWKRPKDEVEFLMKLPQEFFPKMIDELMENNVQVRMMGIRDNLPAHTLDSIDKAISRTKNNTGLILNFALNYGSRKEMTDCIIQLIKEVQAGEVAISDIDESTIGDYLLTKDMPDPDLFIRTSGEIRLSNFMLWQCAYAELWFTDVCWPDFNTTHFVEAIQTYQNRNRRYGGV